MSRASTSGSFGVRKRNCEESLNIRKISVRTSVHCAEHMFCCVTQVALKRCGHDKVRKTPPRVPLNESIDFRTRWISVSVCTYRTGRAPCVVRCNKNTRNTFRVFYFYLFTVCISMLLVS